MKRSLAVLPLLVIAAACAQDQSGPVSPDLAAPAEAKAAPSAGGKYIVVLKRGAKPRDLAASVSASPKRVFTTALNGFAATLTEGQVAALRRNPSVAYVEPDAEAQLFLTQTSAPWGIDRIDQLDLPLSTTFTYVSTGAGVTAYILDTGIRRTHLQFAGRADYIPNGANGDFVGDGRGSAEDCHGHGTHVAGSIGSTTHGVAKGVTLRGGRVVNCSGSGQASMVITAMDWIAANGSKPGVVNMSLGYGNVQAVRDAAERLVAAGFVVATAAGNGNIFGIPTSACTQAPAGAPNVLTVGSTTSSDAESSFSNYGTCVDILAPGSSILSTWYTNDTATNTISGTSMASPHVAGVAALYLGSNPAATPATVMTAIKNAGTLNTITLHSRSRSNGTPNRFLFTNY